MAIFLEASPNSKWRYQAELNFDQFSGEISERLHEAWSRFQHNCLRLRVVLVQVLFHLKDRGGIYLSVTNRRLIQRERLIVKGAIFKFRHASRFSDSLVFAVLYLMAENCWKSVQCLKKRIVFKD
jgi:hypothetical protein